MTPWEIKAKEFANCNCSYGCPCQFNALPTKGFCEAAVAMEIEEGHYGEVKLDGLRMGGIFQWPGAVHEGRGKCQPFVDERADIRQREALLKIMSGQPLLQTYLTAQMEASRYKNEMIPRAGRAYELYLAKYGQMGAAYPEVLVSQRTLFQLQVGYINVLQQLWVTAIALQNYTLSDGLGAPIPSGTLSTTINLPAASGGGGQ